MKKIVITNQACNSPATAPSAGAQTLDFLDVWGDIPLVRSTAQAPQNPGRSTGVPHLPAGSDTIAPVPGNTRSNGLPTYGIVKSALVSLGLLMDKTLVTE